MTPEVYAGVSRKLYEYFCCHRDQALRNGRQDLAPVPDAATIQAIIEAAFWASLRREEGYVPKISLAFLPVDQAGSPIVLDRPLRLDPAVLARVSPAVESPGIHLGVSPDRGDLYVWGITREIPVLCFVLEVAAPGLLVVKHHSGDESHKFLNVAVLEADRIKMLDATARQAVDTNVKLAVAMRAHGRGGLLLIVPSGSQLWRESLTHPIPYAVPSPGEASVDVIAGLTAVDGAVVLTDQYQLLGFGAKIVRRKGCPQVEQVTISEPVEGDVPVLAHPEQLGGTRHLSAAQFIQDQRDARALVASQDGRFTVFEWCAGEQMVHAHRLDALLL
jgi:hypothetical protein